MKKFKMIIGKDLKLIPVGSIIDLGKLHNIGAHYYKGSDYIAREYIPSNNIPLTQTNRWSPQFKIVKITGYEVIDDDLYAVTDTLHSEDDHPSVTWIKAEILTHNLIIPNEN